MRVRGKDKRPQKPTKQKQEKVIALINLSKINSVNTEKNTKSIVYAPPPDNLNACAKAEWKKMIRILHAMNIFEELDGTALALYCEAYAEWVEAGKEMKKPGNKAIMKGKRGGGLYRNPWADQLKSSRKDMSAYLALFGLSPYDRARIKMATPPGGTAPRKEPNEFDEF